MKTPGWLPLRRRGEAAGEPPQAPPAVGVEEDEVRKPARASNLPICAA